MQTLLVLIELYGLLVLAYLVLKLFAKVIKKTNVNQKIKDVIISGLNIFGLLLFWNVPLRFLLEGYLELAVDGFINLKPIFTRQIGFKDSYGGEAVHEVVSNLWAICLMILLMALPFVIFWLI